MECANFVILSRDQFIAHFSNAWRPQSNALLIAATDDDDGSRPPRSVGDGDNGAVVRPPLLLTVTSYKYS